MYKTVHHTKNSIIASTKQSDREEQNKIGNLIEYHAIKNKQRMISNKKYTEINILNSNHSQRFNNTTSFQI